MKFCLRCERYKLPSDFPYPKAEKCSDCHALGKDAPAPTLPRRLDYCKTPEQRKAWFMARTTPEPNTGCWLWIGAANGMGYGHVGGWHRPAHRFAYELFVGPLGDNVDLCHRCDTPLCCNPAHLFPGDVVINLNDMVRKGRCGTAKLTVDQVRELREMADSGSTYRVLSLRFGIGVTAVGDIVRRETWKWVA